MGSNEAMLSAQAPGAAPDADLVAAARAGNRAAFAALVERYQDLVSSLAYALAGGFSDSEDIAQEVFVVAWSRLHELREPDHFRRWLCGIARHLAQRQHEAGGRRGFWRRRSVPAREPASPESSPLERMISREEERAVWQALSEIPEAYRLPLVLFYREQQSVDRVAEALEVSADNVKQRLSRGRRMLRERVTALVGRERSEQTRPLSGSAQIESALARTRPRKELTAAVLAAIALEGGRAEASPRTRDRRAVKIGTGALVTSLAIVGAMYLVRSGGVVRGRGGVAGNGSGGSRPQTGPAPAARSLATEPRVRPDPPGGAAAGVPAVSVERRAPETLLELTFEDGALPLLLQNGGGAVQPCPAPRPGNRHCALATVQLTYTKSNWVEAISPPPKPPLFPFSSTAVASFDYWLDDESDFLMLTVWNSRKNVKAFRTMNAIARRKWVHVELPFRDLKRPSSRNGATMIEGDPIDKYGVRGSRPGGGPLNIDNLKVVDYERAETVPRASTVAADRD